jgi:hypothetical protein
VWVFTLVREGGDIGGGSGDSVELWSLQDSRMNLTLISIKRHGHLLEMRFFLLV